jgi:transposase
MAGAYSQDLRNRVIEAISDGASCRAAAARYAVSVSTAVNWRRRWLETGSAAAKPMGGATNNRIKGEDALWLLALVEAKDDLTLQAMQALLCEERRVDAGIGSIWRFLAANQITLKKRR